MNDIISTLESFLQLIMQSADEFSDEELASLFQVVQDALELVQQEQEGEEEAQIGMGGQPPAPIPPSDHPSSNVNGFFYNPDSEQLKVQFHGKYPEERGPIYSYEGVPGYLFDIISKGAIGPKTSGENRFHKWIRGVTPSLGGSVNAILKAGKFPYQRLS